MVSNKLKFSVLLSNCLVHFDNALYGMLAPIIAKQYFNGYNYLKTLIYIYALYFISLVVRPLAIITFAKLANNISYIMLFKISIIGCCIGTFLTGYSFTFKGAQKIIIVIIIARAIVEASCAIEYTLTKIIMAQENAYNIKNSGFCISSTMLGIILASCMSVIANTHTNIIPQIFFAASALCMCTLLIRSKSNIEISHIHNNLKGIFKNNARVILKIVSLNTFSYMTYILAFLFTNIFAESVLNKPIYIQTTYLLMFDMLFAPLVAYVIKKIPPEVIVKYSLINFAIIGSISYLYMVYAPSIASIVMFRIIVVIAGVIFTCGSIPYEYSLSKNKDAISIIGIGSVMGASIGKQILTFMLFIWNISGSLYSIFFIILLLSITTYYIISLDEN